MAVSRAAMERQRPTTRPSAQDTVIVDRADGFAGARPHLVIEIDSLGLDDERPIADLRVYRSDVLPQDAQKEQLHRRNTEQSDDHRGYADWKVVPEQQLHDEIHEGRHEAEDRTE